LTKSKNHILFTVRDIYVNEVKNKWNLRRAITFNIRETDYEKAGLSIIEYINSQSGN
jgi:hypothetical protein